MASVLGASPFPVGRQIPEREPLSESDPCAIARRWRISEDLAHRLVSSADQYVQETRGTVQIISGFRTRDEQRALAREGRPTAPDEVSTHRSCPATGADVALGFLPTRVQKAIWGRIVTMNGLRWGGGGPVDEGGIPEDWGHVDRGPRTG